MKTKLFLLGLLGCTVAGLQAGPDADALDRALAWQAKNDAAIASRSSTSDAETQAKILAELQKQTKLLEAQRPIIIYDPKATPAPVTQVPVR